MLAPVTSNELLSKVTETPDSMMSDRVRLTAV